jgi:DNA-binding winged helix-turn-helix (wHTH) protein/Flp pilus assembly protein TadD
VGHIAFGPFSLDVEAARLLRDGVDVDLRPQAFNALRTLIQNCGRHVDYEHMIQQAWDGVSVSRHTVAVTIGEAKKVLREYGSWIHYRPKLGYRLEIPPAEDLIRKGWHFANRYTRDGFEKALECFGEAAAADSADFRVFEGMSLCYLMLGAYGMRPPREMYPRFLDAHAEAVALEGLTPELRAARAHAIHVFERKFAEAECELLTARKEAPQQVSILGHLVMLYATSHRFEEALTVLQQALAIDPLWPMLPAIEVFVRMCARQFDRAAACGKKAVELHPYLPLGRFFYARSLEYSGQVCAALEQFRLAIVMSPDFPWLRAHEAACLAKLGKSQEAERILGELEDLRRTDYVDAYSMVCPYLTLGHVDRAFAELARASEENSAPLFVMDVDPNMDGLREDPRFRHIRNSVFGHSSSYQAVLA